MIKFTCYLLLVTFCLAGCANTTTARYVEESRDPSQTEKTRKERHSLTMTNPSPNSQVTLEEEGEAPEEFESQELSVTSHKTIIVTGKGVADPADDNPDRAKIRARRAAVMDGYRKLLERMGRADIEEPGKPGVITQEIQGTVRGAEIIGERFDGKVYIVEMMLSLE